MGSFGLYSVILMGDNGCVGNGFMEVFLVLFFSVVFSFLLLGCIGEENGEIMIVDLEGGSLFY